MRYWQVKGLNRINRDTDIDCAKGILIVLVLIGHLGADVKGDNVILNLVTFLIYTFHMPAFVFISGYLSKNLEKSRESGFRSILMYFLFQVSWSVFSVAVLHDYTPALRMYEPGPALWYILALGVWRFFQKEILSIRCCFLISVVLAILSVCTAEVLPMMAIPRIIGFMPFFLLGYYTSTPIIKEKIQGSNIFISVLGAIVLILFSWVCIKNQITLSITAHNYGYKTINNNIYMALVLNLVIYIINFIGVFVFVRLSYCLKNCKYFVRVGGNTLYIYVLSNYFQKVWYVILHKYNLLFANDYLNYGVSLIVSAAVIFICCSDIVVKVFDYIVDKYLALIKTK